MMAPAGTLVGTEAGALLNVTLAAQPTLAREQEGRRLIVYGNVYNRSVLEGCDLTSLDKPALRSLLRQLAGYFCLVFEDHPAGTTCLANDCYANYRLYCYRAGSRVAVSDEWKPLADRIRGGHGSLEIVLQEKQYFKRHRYTTGGHTWLKHLDKLRPATLLSCSPDGVEADNYFPVVRKGCEGAGQYASQNCELVISSLRGGLDERCPTFLFFTGGIDSTYLACLMRRAGVDFTPLFARFYPADRDNQVDYIKARRMADRLGLKLEIVDTDLAQHLELLPAIVHRHPFDKCLAIPLEFSLKSLAERRGACNVVNGQSSDSLYCWGASGRTLGSFIQRGLTSSYYLRLPPVVRRAVAATVTRLYRRRWSSGAMLSVPSRLPDYWLGLLDPQGYVPVIHSAPEDYAYRAYLSSIVASISGELGGDEAAIRLYLKMMYLQGPSNRIWVEAARAYGHNLVMPFVDARLLGLRLRSQNELANLLRPRYVLESLLREEGLEPGLIHECDHIAIDHVQDRAFAALLQRVYHLWDQECAAVS